MKLFYCVRDAVQGVSDWLPDDDEGGRSGIDIVYVYVPAFCGAFWCRFWYTDGRVHHR